MLCFVSKNDIYTAPGIIIILIIIDLPRSTTIEVINDPKEIFSVSCSVCLCLCVCVCEKVYLSVSVLFCTFEKAFHLCLFQTLSLKNHSTRLGAFGNVCTCVCVGVFVKAWHFDEHVRVWD